MKGTKDIFLRRLNSLASYIEAGTEDYLKDNSIQDYLEHGNGDRDIALLKSVMAVRDFVTNDEFPWWEGDYDKATEVPSAGAVEIPLDYGLDAELVRITDEPALTATADEEMDWINDHVAWESDELERIMRHAVALFNTQQGYTFGQALRQAIIWERG